MAGTDGFKTGYYRETGFNSSYSPEEWFKIYRGCSWKPDGKSKG